MRLSKPAHCLRGWYALFRFSSVAVQSDRPEVEMFVARGFEKSRAGCLTPRKGDPKMRVNLFHEMNIVV